MKALRKRRQRDGPSATLQVEKKDVGRKKASEALGPALLFIGDVVSKAEPHVERFVTLLRKAYHYVEPYHPDDLTVALYGFCLVFFGGTYMTLVAAGEAVYIFGWDKISHAGSSLWVNLKRAKDAYERDNLVDENRDGVADVKQISKQELAARKFLVVTKSVDPQQVAAATEGLMQAAMAVMATLKIKFAKAITLGHATGDVLIELLGTWTESALDASLPNDYKKWTSVIVRYGFRLAGVSVSWLLLRLVTSFFAALRGASLLVVHVCQYLVKYNYVEESLIKKGKAFVVTFWALIALFGFYYQVSMQFTLPFPLNILLLPVTIAEKTLAGILGVTE